MSLLRARLTAAAVLALAATAVAGCSSGSDPSPPAGVDGLTIPTSDPQPSDFVDEVDHPWLQLVPGETRLFEGHRGYAVNDGPELDGIATTSMSHYTANDPAAGTVDYIVAQDRAGNVWCLGRSEDLDVVWFDEPGLFLPAVPRRGDGWLVAAAPGLDVRAEVVDDDEDVTVPAGEYDDAIVLEVVENGVTRRETYVRGTGLVEIDGAGLLERLNLLTGEVVD